MSPEEIAERLAGLAEAGRRLRRERAPAEIVASLASVLEAWRDPGSEARGTLEGELPKATGFSKPAIAKGLAVGLEPYSGDALRKLARSELGTGAEGGERLEPFDVTAVLLAGSIPMPTLVSLLAPLCLGGAVLAKTASRDPVTAPLFAKSLAATDPALGACLDVVSFPGSDAARTAALLDANCLAVTGSDETVASVSARIPPGRHLVAHGHRLSIAVLGPESGRGAALDEAAAGLALDVALWDQLGCLSPLAVYAVGMDAGSVDRVAERLAEALCEAQRRWPLGEVEAAAAAACAHERADAELRAADGRRVGLHAGDGFTVVREADARLRPAPLFRFVRVHPVGDADALASAVRPLAPHLASAAIAGFGGGDAGVRDAVAALGASRTCRPGGMQSPQLAWSRDARGVLRPFARAAGRD